jgi:predicted permease
MLDLISLILPIVILIAVGFAAIHAKVVSPQLVQALGVFVLNFALPALILNALLQQDLRQTLNWNYILVYGAGSLLSFGIVFVAARHVLRRPLPAAAMSALGGSASNSGFVGFPVASLAIGAPALTALPLSMLVENILIIPLALAIAESTGHRGKSVSTVIGQTAWRLARTPLILAIVIGAVLSAAGVRPPMPLATTLSMMADAAVPCALLVVGGTLATLQVQSVAADVSLIAAGKLILHPILVALGFAWIGGVPPGLAAAGIILASAPMLTVYPIIGARFGQERQCAAALLATTVAAFATMIVVLGYLLAGDV